MGVFLFSVYYILLPMASRCTCCHICHTSVKTSRRTFFPCSSCPSIICRQCIEGNGEEWDSLGMSEDWDCPRCRDACPCKRCKNRSGPSLHSKQNSSQSSPDQLGKRSRSISPLSSPEGKRRRANDSQIISGLGLSNAAMATPSELSSVTPQTTSPEKPTTLVEELHNKSEQCLSYIGRTERLLELVREEQSRISSELHVLMSSEKEPDSSRSEVNTPISV